MGGQITVGIRHTLNGKPEQMFAHRWTNDFPWRFMQPSFLDQGEELKRYVDEAKPENEWPEAVLLPELKNSEYGIVLIDFPSREVYSRQGYNTPGVLHYVPRQSTADKEEFAGLMELVRRGQIDHFDRFDLKTSRTKTVSPDVFVAASKQPNAKIMWSAYLSPSVFKVDSKLDKPESLTKAKRWMLAHGWTPSSRPS